MVMVGPFSEAAAAAARALLALSISSRIEELVLSVVWETSFSVCLLFSDFTGAVFVVLPPIVVFLEAMGDPSSSMQSKPVPAQTVSTQQTASMQLVDGRVEHEHDDNVNDDAIDDANDDAIDTNDDEDDDE
jgi:hypothetical protein